MTRRTREKPEPTIALINVVFLMLIFFLVAGTIAQPLDGDLKLVRTADLDPASPPDALVISADGALSFRGRPMVDITDYLAQEDRQPTDVIQIVPDRDLAASRLIEVGAALRTGGAQKVMIVTERTPE
jgi:biopolymer transport protein ExbD